MIIREDGTKERLIIREDERLIIRKDGDRRLIIREDGDRRLIIREDGNKKISEKPLDVLAREGYGLVDEPSGKRERLYGGKERTPLWWR